MSTGRALEAELAAAGIATSYVDGFGERREVSEATLRRLLGLLHAGPPAAPARTAAMPCHLPDALARGERWWGLGVQLYALRSQRNWGIGDFTDLRTLGLLAAGVGADFVALNPLHARSLAVPELASPYSPTSRLFLDPIYIDPHGVPEFAEHTALRRELEQAAWRERLERLRSREQIDYAGVCRAKLQVFRELHRLFRERHVRQDTERAREFADFTAGGGAPLDHYARFEARRLHDVLDVPPDVEELADLHRYLQWIADGQLAEAATALREAGMRIGLYRDLALGPDRAGAEANDPAAALLKEVSAGAPPDAFNPQGQMWDLAVFDPHALTARRGAPFADMLAANMRHAGALRIDHVMGLQRLFWIIAGADAPSGTYVTYPYELLAGVLAECSRDARCLVVGEDLGTVPAGFRESLRERSVLGCRVLWFERDGDGRFREPAAFPRAAVVSATTHDLPTIVGYWTGRDIELRRALAIYADDAEHARALEERCRARAALADALGALPAEASHIADGEVPPGLCAAVHAHVAKTPAMLVQVQLDDVLELRDAVNLPGTLESQHPNWRRKLPVALERLTADPRFSALATLDR